MWRIGHRGAAGHAPENTLASIETALEIGVDMVEVDVQATADGRLVLLHDKWVDRTTDGTGRIRDLPWERVRRLDAGRGERVPLLEDAMALVRGRSELLIELIVPEIADRVGEAIARAGRGHEVVVASFHHRAVLDFRRAYPGVRTLALQEGIPVYGARFALEAEVDLVGASVDSLTKPYVEGLHGHGLRLFVYTVNDERDIHELHCLGVDGLISDYPERVPRPTPAAVAPA